ncbi:hypothetical protein CD175_24070 [Pseudomonas laurylsulfatiphila]|uniref:Uncharacterized protein n=1 Tax=Pseudomonas laurylsulfatiphila TaxID=2011015 RepID=A0A2S6FH07_9PSED|nr:hypothetical protein CD175_24070 [Pseudomonas laurylsulfatiphila]
MPSTLTAGGKDGKQSKKIERNTRERVFIEILLLQMVAMILFFARGSGGAQLVWGMAGRLSVPVKLPSRASSLPHWICVNTDTVGASLLAMASAALRNNQG